MKQSAIKKEHEAQAASAEQMQKINEYARRELTPDEVYVFSLVLCDNEVDRDYERFPAESLKVLAELYKGKTGIFDHNPKGKNQTARIFDTAIELDSTRKTSAGEDYCALRAWAYMVRCDKNADLILEIDAGIKKEVSVGCAVERTECSVCGADVRKDGCAHEAGKLYNDVLCWHELIHPTDAYEWSFVAVPAQKQAGVTKGLCVFGDADGVIKSLESGAVTLTKQQASRLAAQIRELDHLAQAGRRHIDGLRKEMVRLAAFAMPELDAAVLAEVAGCMEEHQLDAFCKGFSQKAPAFLQLGRAADDETSPADDVFKV